jgi:hypothetical protein
MSTHSRDRAAIGESTDRDSHRRSFSGPKRHDDLIGYTHPGRRLSAEFDDRLEFHDATPSHRTLNAFEG